MLLKNLLREDVSGEKVLYKNDWVSLMSKDTPDGETYVYSHETRCNGNIIAVLLYERNGLDSWKYGVRKEKTPCWGGQAEISSLTGGVDEGDTPIQAAIKELKEEGGYECEEKDLEPLGTCRGTKSCDTMYHLYALDVSGKTAGEATGEDSGNIVWLSKTESFKKVVCPIFHVMFNRLGYN